MAKSAFRIIISSIIGFLIFLILLAIANLLMLIINNPVYIEIVRFFNSNITFLLIIAIIGILNEIFWNFYFPFNLVAPVSSSVLSFYIVMFIYKLFNLISQHLKTGFKFPIDVNLASVLVAGIVFISGYIAIIARLSKQKPAQDFEGELRKERLKFQREKLETQIKKMHTEVDNINKLNKTNKIKWADIGDEFKHALYNLGKSINSLFKGKKIEGKKEIEKKEELKERKGKRKDKR